MQFFQDIMANYLHRTFVSNGNHPGTNEKSKKGEENAKPKTYLDAGSGDFEYDNISLVSNSESITSLSKYNCFPPEKSLHKQEQNTKTLVTSLEHEIAESKEDISYLHNHIYSAEEVFPKRWEICQYLKNLCREQVEAVSMEMLKWKRKSERFDLEMKELEQRIDSWQCIIDKAKEVQIQEVDFFD